MICSHNQIPAGLLLPSVLWRCWLGSRKGIRPVKNMGDGGGGHWLVQMEWSPARWSMRLPVNLPLHHKVQKFSSGTGSPRWSQKKGRKTVVVWCGGLQVIISTAPKQSHLICSPRPIHVLKMVLHWMWGGASNAQVVSQHDDHGHHSNQRLRLDRPTLWAPVKLQRCCHCMLQSVCIAQCGTGGMVNRHQGC